MKKITLIVQSKDIDDSLRVLRCLGSLHIEQQKFSSDRDLTKFRQDIYLATKSIAALPASACARKGIKVAAKKNREKPINNPKDLICEILNLTDEQKAISEDIKKIEKDIQEWKDWGGFNPKHIEDLKNKNIRLQLCKISVSQIRLLPKKIILEKLFKKGNLIYCALISTEEIKLPFNTLSLPEIGLTEMLARQKEKEEKMMYIEKRLSEIAAHKDVLCSYEKQLKSMACFEDARAAMGRFKKLSYLKGYCPADRVNAIEKVAEDEKWGILTEEPSKNDNVPTLIRNPRWIKIIKPLFQMIKIVPGYREMDTSYCFLLFFSLFFGMLIGDAGYGIVFLIAALFCRKRFKNLFQDKSIFSLIYVLSICTIIWGIFSGTFFGQSWLPDGIKPLLPNLRNSSNVQSLCFFIGALHLTIAHLWKAIRKMPSLKTLSDIGWIFILWAAFFLAKLLILGKPFPAFAKGFLLAGTGLIILFTNPNKNILKNIGDGLGNLFLHIMNSFTDIISYLRLFAVGAATVAVADAFNQMAFSVGHNNIGLLFLTAIILLLGHTLNILLGAMAVLVHGVRLNVLEFCGHLDMEWSGLEYTPFKQTS